MPPSATPVEPAARPDMSEKLDLLARLGELKDAGVLTDDEFETQKAAILAATADQGRDRQRRPRRWVSR